MKTIILLAIVLILHSAFAGPHRGLADRKINKDSAADMHSGDSDAEGQQDAEQGFGPYEIESVTSLDGAPIAGPNAAPFPPDTVPSTPKTWKLVAALDMADPLQRCPPSLNKIASPRASCAKKTFEGGCDSVPISTFGASYQTVCGRFRGYQIGSPDAFLNYARLGKTVEDPYVDGISITYGPSGRRQHVFTLAAGGVENRHGGDACPCAGGTAPAPFIGSDYFCESGNFDRSGDVTSFYYSDPLWDGQQCNGYEATCCNPAGIPWFCKNFPTQVSSDLEVRICMDEPVNNENVALEFFELYIK